MDKLYHSPSVQRNLGYRCGFLDYLGYVRSPTVTDLTSAASSLEAGAGKAATPTSLTVLFRTRVIPLLRPFGSYLLTACSRLYCFGNTPVQYRHRFYTGNSRYSSISTFESCGNWSASTHGSDWTSLRLSMHLCPTTIVSLLWQF